MRAVCMEDFRCHTVLMGKCNAYGFYGKFAMQITRKKAGGTFRRFSLAGRSGIFCALRDFARAESGSIENVPPGCVSSCGFRCSFRLLGAVPTMSHDDVKKICDIVM